MGRREGAEGISLIARGILQQDEERRQFRQRVELALAEKQIEAAYPNLSPTEQLRRGIMDTQRDILAPGLLENQINRMAQLPGSQEQIGQLQTQYGGAVSRQQQAQDQYGVYQEQAKALQQAGLLGSQGEQYQILTGSGSSPRTSGSLRDMAIEELRRLGQPLTEANVEEAMRQLRGG